MIMQKTEYDVPEDEGMMIKFSFPTRLPASDFAKMHGI